VLYDYDAFLHKISRKKGHQPELWGTWEQTCNNNNIETRLLVEETFKGKWVQDFDEEDAYQHLIHLNIGNYGRVYVWPSNFKDLEGATGKEKKFWSQNSFPEIYEEAKRIQNEPAIVGFLTWIEGCNLVSP
jgi:hypothetical protein